jgi:hypothetical protein
MHPQHAEALLDQQNQRATNGVAEAAPTSVKYHLGATRLASMLVLSPI